MSTLTIASPARTSKQGYLKNLGRAVAALFAVSPHRSDASSGRATLYQLANRYDNSMPNLATELRFIASRG